MVDRSMHERWQLRWEIERHRSIFGLMKTKIENWHWTRSKNRIADVYMTRLRLRKVNLNKYLQKIGAVDTNLCTRCMQQQVEDVHHFLLQCPAYSVQRNKMRTNLLKMGVTIMNTDTLLGASNF